MSFARKFKRNTFTAHSVSPGSFAALAAELSDQALRGIATIIKRCSDARQLDPDAQTILLADPADALGRRIVDAVGVGHEGFLVQVEDTASLAENLQKFTPNVAAMLGMAKPPVGFINLVIVGRGKVGIRPCLIDEALTFAAAN